MKSAESQIICKLKKLELQFFNIERVNEFYFKMILDETITLLTELEKEKTRSKALIKSTIDLLKKEVYVIDNLEEFQNRCKGISEMIGTTTEIAEKIN